MRVPLFLSLGLALSACAPNMNVVILDPPGEDYVPVHHTLVQEFREKAGHLGAQAIVLEPIADPGGGTFGLSPVRGDATAIPEDLPVHDSIVRGFVQDIYDELRAADFNPLPPGTWESVREGLASEEEGLVDPITRLKNLDQTQTLEHRILRTLREEHGADGFLFPEIRGVTARHPPVR